MALIKHLDAELMTNLREYEVEEQSLETEVARFEGQNLLAPLYLFRETKKCSRVRHKYPACTTVFNQKLINIKTISVCGFVKQVFLRVPTPRARSGSSSELCSSSHK